MPSRKKTKIKNFPRFPSPLLLLFFATFVAALLSPLTSSADAFFVFNPPGLGTGPPEAAGFNIPPFSAKEARTSAPLKSSWTLQVPDERQPELFIGSGVVLPETLCQEGGRPAGSAVTVQPPSHASVFFFNDPGDGAASFEEGPEDFGPRNDHAEYRFQPGGQSGEGPTSGAKTWTLPLSDTETLTGNASIASNMPNGPMLKQEDRVYGFSTSGSLVSRRFDPLVLTARAQGGYSSSAGDIPFALSIDAGGFRPAGKKLVLSGSYGLNTLFNAGPDGKQPVTHHFGGSLGYELGPGIDVNGSVAYDVPDCPGCARQEVYDGGMNWRPSAHGSVRGGITFVNSANESSYEVSAGYSRRLYGASAFSIATDFSRDWIHMDHERLVLAYNWKCGKWGLAATSATSLDHYPAPSPDVLGQSLFLKMTRSFALP